MKTRKIAVLGLGYVGLPVAEAFARKELVIAFDINVQRIEELKNNFDATGVLSNENLLKGNFLFTANPEDLQQANFFIIAVPTPVDKANQPDLHALLKASQLLAPFLKIGDIVVYESTVYPGATEEECAPMLEKYSDLTCGKDFFIGYSPERINPGDAQHTFTKIQKIVAAQNIEILDIIDQVYSSVIHAGVYRATSIKVAEAAKVIENSQRDLNIAFVNELAMICHQLEINTQDVLDAAATKWNFLPFKPGLVGGHCIGVDPYYLTYKATMLGLHPQIILAGRRVNDSMGKYIAEHTAKLLAQHGVNFSQAKVGILGLTFKENCADIRNTKVIDIINELQEFGVTLLVNDPLADLAVAQHEYGIFLSPLENFQQLDAIILAVPHQEYQLLSVRILKQMLKTPILVDVKSVLDVATCHTENIILWRL